MNNNRGIGQSLMAVGEAATQGDDAIEKVRKLRNVVNNRSHPMYRPAKRRKRGNNKN